MKISTFTHVSSLTFGARGCTKFRKLCRQFTSEALQSQLYHDLTSRKPYVIFDYISPTPSHLLNITLADFLPKSCYPETFSQHDLRLPCQGILPQGHHLVYFSPQIPGKQLLPDGTDPLQSPGEPFVRRMWAGGSLEFDDDPTKQVAMASKRVSCTESITGVSLKGVEPEEKVFVTIKREIQDCLEFQSKQPHPKNDHLSGVGTEESRPSALVETRNLVFMRPTTAAAMKLDAPTPRKIVRRKSFPAIPHLEDRSFVTHAFTAPYEPDYSVSLIPTQSLLFRFSALTFNAHAIHLDPEYCREVEGHRNLLVHGPLSLVLMLSVLRSQMVAPKILRRFDYRNLAPLYADEEMKVCVRKSRLKEKTYEVWIEGRDGGYAVKGTAITS